MKNKFSYILIILIFISCNKTKKQEKPNIEIYLTKNRIKTYQGIEISDIKIDSLGYDKYFNKLDFNIIRLDTLTSEFIFAGAFIAKKTDLKTEPFLKNSEILEFNSKTGFLKINSLNSSKISKLTPSYYGHQFVLTINNEPKLFGYFYSYPFSYYCHTYNYDYTRTLQKTEFNLKHGINMRTVDLEKENPELYSILRNNEN